MKRRKSAGKRPSSGRQLRSGYAFVKWGILAFLLLFVAFALYVGYLDRVIRNNFEGKRWSLPAVVYARPLEIYPGLAITAQEFEDELQLAGYRRDRKTLDPGGYDRQDGFVRLVTRDFHFPDGQEKSARITVFFDGGSVQAITRTDTGESIEGARLDPARIGSFHPKQHEDRIVLTREELPDLLVKTLLAVEDHKFYTHTGLDPLAILRALLANVMARGTVQGGSTLTQQLVKNFFLSNERTLWRKANEAIMALLLEAHYDKDEILTAYANEIFLGQDGGRAVHGFGLASLFYFRRDLKDLSPAQMAMLVGMVRGPSYYDPRKDSERCLKRRRVVLDVMLERGVIDNHAHRQAMAAPLGNQGITGTGFNRFPAFLDLVRRQLSEEYQEKDLTTDGLKIFTTLDPRVQVQVEKHLDSTIERLEKNTGKKGIEGAVVVTRREGGEVLAIAGGRKALQSGFNRALDAKRPIGSLVKPAVYLTALGNGYTLATPVDDTALTLPNPGGKQWTPMNYDRLEHGRVPFYMALANSYNLSTVRIGTDVGIKKVVQTLKKLGVDEDVPAYPSVLLGAVSLSPLKVAQLYQTLASGGFYLPQRVISSVLAADNSILKRFGISVEQRFTPETIFLLNNGLQHVVSDGTARSLSHYLPPSHNVAGKTGTSDDLRDSWFAGFTGDQLAVVWLGRDDNKPMGLSGSSGALVVWGEIMRALRPQPLDFIEPEGIEWRWLDTGSLELSADRPLFGGEQVRLPFLAGSVPVPENNSLLGEPAKAVGGVVDKIMDWFN